jgi:serine/threonine protein kinase
MRALESNDDAGERYCPTCEKTFATGDRCPDDNTRLVKLGQTTDPLIGRELEGRYTILEQLGGGGMGTVYRGKQHSVGRECAIKVIKPSLVREPIVIKRFLREAKLASRLAHPNAVAVLDFGQTDDGLFFLVMELVDGKTLDKLLAEGPLAPMRAIRIGTQICDALEGAHALAIVHRDLKPANVMVLSTGRDLVKVLDFGLAKSLAVDASSARTTSVGTWNGTAAYVAPEVASGDAADARADLYSLGCMLHQLLSGKLPFWNDNVHTLVAMHLNDPPPKLPGIPRPLAQVIERLLAKRPRDRYASAAEAREALEASLSLHDTLEDGPGFGSTIVGWSGPANGPIAALPPEWDGPTVRTPGRDVDPLEATATVRLTGPRDAVFATTEPPEIKPVATAPEAPPRPRTPTPLSKRAPTPVPVRAPTPVPVRAPTPHPVSTRAPTPLPMRDAVPREISPSATLPVNAVTRTPWLLPAAIIVTALIAAVVILLIA